MGPSAPKHGQICTLLMTFPSWSLSRPLLMAILEDRLSDQFVAQLVWERLGYRPSTGADGMWRAGPQTPADWSEAFPEAPPVIAARPAAVRLTRSIPKPYKQLLKEQLHFTGYRIGELYPRRTRRATVVNWLLAFLALEGQPLLEEGALPPLLAAPADPVQGHPGDPPVG